jgi:serine/threonine protein kinase
MRLRHVSFITATLEIATGFHVQLPSHPDKKEHRVSLEPGQTLQSYRIIDQIGAGGMGEVWRAADNRLDRKVAIKVLPASFADNKELRARFEREAKTISSLNHPNICTLFDIGHENDIHYLVMELIEGESLGDRIRQGALPVEKVLEIGTQIASALETAHAQGIVHRDLKPDNVMLTKSGAKLLDFGLAKSAGGLGPSVDSVTSLPTENRPLTEEGSILGTLHYMAPEQLDGTEADSRTDIFALGTILYEMATGRRAFDASGRASLIAAIVEREPAPISSIQPLVPPALERIVSVCLRKDPAERWQTAHDVRLGLEWAAQAGSAAGIPAPVTVKRKNRERLAWAATAVLLLTCLASGWLAVARGRALGDRRKIVASITAPEGSRFETFGGNIGSLTLSPDGRWMTFAASTPERSTMLFIRPLNSAGAQPIDGTEGAFFPFWAPDSRQIGFFAGGKLKKIDRTGGAAISVCDAPNGRGGTWNSDGVILFTPETQTPIHRVSAGGGTATPITELDPTLNETTHRYPVFLPDGKNYLYLRASHGLASRDEGNAIWIGNLDSSEKTRLMQSGSDVFFSQGHILFVRDGFLMAQPFDLSALEFSGDPFAIDENVGFLANFFKGAFTVSQNGILAFQQGFGVESQLIRLDSNGKELGKIGEVDRYQQIRLSPDGKKLAVTLFELGSGTADLWLYDISRQAKSRLTFDEANDVMPIWSPDGTRIAFQSGRTGAGDIYVRQVGGGSAAELLYGADRIDAPEDWSPDGAYIAFNKGTGANDLWILPVDGGGEAFPLIQSEFDVGYARFAPDGRWIGYISNESGRYELYATRFPSGDGKWQLSIDGADWLVGWRTDGREIYYLDLEGDMYAVEVNLGEDLVAGLPRELFPTRADRTWDVSADGREFIIGKPVNESSDLSTTLIVNWLARD